MIYAICATEEFIKNHLSEIETLRNTMLELNGTEDVRVLEFLWPQHIKDEDIFNYCVRPADELVHVPICLDGAVILWEEPLVANAYLIKLRIIQGISSLRVKMTDFKTIFGMNEHEQDHRNSG